MLTVLTPLFAGSPRLAEASEETVAYREHSACVELRNTGRSIEALQRCRAAYDALPDDLAEPPLNARSLIAFDSYHSALAAYEASGDVTFLCAGEALLREFLTYLDQRLPPDARPFDRKDGQELLADLGARRGARTCSESSAPAPVSALAPAPTSAPTSAPTPAPTSTPTSTPAPAPRASASPLPQQPLTPAPDHPAPRSGLRIAGGVTLGAGLLFSLVSAGAVIASARIEADRNRLVEASDHVDIGSMGYARGDQLNTSGRLANRVAIGTGVTAGAAIITSITLLALDTRRRRAQRLSFAPALWPLGGQLSCRF